MLFTVDDASPLFIVQNCVVYYGHEPKPVFSDDREIPSHIRLQHMNQMLVRIAHCQFIEDSDLVGDDTMVRIRPMLPDEIIDHHAGRMREGMEPME